MHPLLIIDLVHGICYGVTKGSVRISLEVETASNSIFTVGYASDSTRLYVDEIQTPTYTEDLSSRACPSLAQFNLRQFTTTLTWSGFPVGDPKIWVGIDSISISTILTGHAQFKLLNFV